MLLSEYTLPANVNARTYVFTGIWMITHYESPFMVQLSNGLTD